MTIEDVVRSGWPNASEENIEYVLWTRTPYPFGLSARGLYKASSRAYRAVLSKRRLCDFCDRETFTGSVCGKCNDLLRGATNGIK